KRLTPAQARSLGPRLRELMNLEALRPPALDGSNASARSGPRDAFRLRIDCALVPFLSADPDLASRPEDLAQWGVFGCEGGAALGARRVDGRDAPCSFAEPHELDGFRAFAARPPEPCASCTLRSVCRG